MHLQRRLVLLLFLLKLDVYKRQELGECVSGREQPEDVVLAEELKKEINRFLHGLSTREPVSYTHLISVFVRSIKTQLSREMRKRFPEQIKQYIYGDDTSFWKMCIRDSDDAAIGSYHVFFVVWRVFSCASHGRVLLW